MRIAPLRRKSGANWEELLLATRGPAERLLTASLRSVARRQPDAFSRLGAVRQTIIRIAPSDMPVAFEMRPSGTRGWIRIVRQSTGLRDASACISGPLQTLLAVFDGRGDADGAFFQRQIDIAGDTAAVLALHNALEASELTVADILGLPKGLDPALKRAMAVLTSLSGRLA
jgi:predicted lipid carrier protein YhbT